MKDPDDLPVSHVVARAAGPARWDDVHETVGDVRRARVSVLFDAGPRDKTGELRRQIAAQAEEIARLKTAVDALGRRMDAGPGEHERK